MTFYFYIKGFSSDNDDPHNGDYYSFGYNQCLLSIQRNTIEEAKEEFIARFAGHFCDASENNAIKEVLIFSSEPENFDISLPSAKELEEFENRKAKKIRQVYLEDLEWHKEEIERLKEKLGLQDV